MTAVDCGPHFDNPGYHSTTWENGNTPVISSSATVTTANEITWKKALTNVLRPHQVHFTA